MIYLNEMQGNPFQPDVNFRGYTASSLLGEPKGIRFILTAWGRTGRWAYPAAAA